MTCAPVHVPEKAMVFAAGLGTRMRPITNTMPKPLVVVAGRTLLDHTLDRLADAGVREAIVNVHYFPDQIIAHLRDRASPRIIISDERRKLLDQGGGVKKALDTLGTDPFIVCNTDAFWIESGRSNLCRLAAAWNPRDMDGLLLLSNVEKSVGVEGKGDFLMDDEGRLSRPSDGGGAPFVYTGVGILKPELFAGDARDVFGLAPILFALAARGRLRGVTLDGVWLHVGAPEAITAATQACEQYAR